MAKARSLAAKAPFPKPLNQQEVIFQFSGQGEFLSLA